MIPDWPPGQVGLTVALLCEEAQAVTATEDRDLTSSEWSDLLQAICEAAQDYIKPDDAGRVLIAYFDPPK